MAIQEKPKVSFLMKKIWHDNCFSYEEIKRLESFAEVVDREEEFSFPLTEWANLTVELKKHDENKMIELIENADGILTCWETPKITPEMLRAADKLKIICHCAGTIKPHISEEALRVIRDRNIVVTNTSVALGKGVAEFTLGMIILGLKKVFFMQDEIKQGKWQEIRKMATDPFDVIIGVIGGGFCGGHVIKLLQNFEVKVLLYDPYKTEEECKKIGAEKVELEYLLSHSDVITLHAPNIPRNEKLIDKKRIQQIKDGAVFINTSRGMLVDEEALIEELKTGRFYACLDVTRSEPPAIDNPLRNMKNVFLTPHIAGHASNGMKRQGRYAVDGLERFFNGEEVKYRIKKERLDTMA